MDVDEGIVFRVRLRGPENPSLLNLLLVLEGTQGSGWAYFCSGCWGYEIAGEKYFDTYSYQDHCTVTKQDFQAFQQSAC